MELAFSNLWYMPILNTISFVDLNVYTDVSVLGVKLQGLQGIHPLQISVTK